MIEIQTGLADRAHPRVGGEGGELPDGVVRRVMDVARMNADAGVHARVVRDGEVGVQIAEAGRQRDQAADPGGVRPVEQTCELRRAEPMGGEMAVGIG